MLRSNRTLPPDPGSVAAQPVNSLPPDPSLVIGLIEAFRSSKVLFVAVSLGIFDFSSVRLRPRRALHPSSAVNLSRWNDFWMQLSGSGCCTNMAASIGTRQLRAPIYAAPTRIPWSVTFSIQTKLSSHCGHTWRMPFERVGRNGNKPSIRRAASSIISFAPTKPCRPFSTACTASGC